MPSDDPCYETSCWTVSIVNYTDNQAYQVLVRRADLRVLRVIDAPGQPGLAADEHEAAHAIADRDARVQPLAGATHVHRLEPHHASHVQGPCATHRCAAVFYQTPDGRTVVALTDLTTETVASVTVVP